MSDNVVRLAPGNLGVLGSLIKDDTVICFGQIPMRLDSRFNTVIAGEARSRIAFFGTHPHRLFVLEGEMSMNGVASGPTRPSKALSVSFDHAGRATAMEVGTIPPITRPESYRTSPPLSMVSSHGLHASFGDIGGGRWGCARVLIAPVQWQWHSNHGFAASIIGKDRMNPEINVNATEKGSSVEQYFEFNPLTTPPTSRVVAIKDQNLNHGFGPSMANDGLIRIVSVVGRTPQLVFNKVEHRQPSAARPPQWEKLESRLRSDEMILSEVSRGLHWIATNPLHFPASIDERFAQTAFSWVDRMIAQLNPATHDWRIHSAMARSPGLGSAAFHMLTTASNATDASPAYRAFQTKTECNCSPMSPKCGNPFCSFRSSRTDVLHGTDPLLAEFQKVLIPFQVPANATTMAQMDMMTQQANEARAKIAARWSFQQSHKTKISKRMQETGESYDEATDFLIQNVGAAKSTASKSTASKSVASSAASVLPAAPVLPASSALPAAAAPLRRSSRHKENGGSKSKSKSKSKRHRRS